MNKKMRFLRIIILTVLIPYIIFMTSCVFMNQQNELENSKNTELVNDIESISDFNENSSAKYNTEEDRAESPEGYNPDIFEFCGYESGFLGKTINDVIEDYGLFVVNTTIVGPEGRTFYIPIYAKEGQTVVQAIDKRFSPYPTYYFILDDDIVNGLVFLDVDGLQNISRYMDNSQVAPRKVPISPGLANAEDILCWRFENGYRLIFSTDVGGQTCALGFADVIDPTQCSDYTNLIYGPIRDNYSDKKYMPEQLFCDLRGRFFNPDSNMFIEIDSQDCIYRSLINGEYGKKDYFYLDRFDSYEEVGNNKYLIKVKCGDTKLSYLTVDEYFGDGTGRQTLYLNAVDEWTYSEDYIENAKYVFYRDFTYNSKSNNSSTTDGKGQKEGNQTIDSFNTDNSLQTTEGKESIIAGDVQTGEDKIYETDRLDTKIVGKEYTAPFGSELIKQGEDYYLYPPLYDNILCAKGGSADYIPFDEPLRISKNAEVGLIKDIEVEFNGEENEYLFIYEYNDFYKMIDNLIDDNRWEIDEYNMLYFEYKEMRIGAYPLIILDENGDIIMFKEYHYQIAKYL